MFTAIGGKARLEQRDAERAELTRLGFAQSELDPGARKAKRAQLELDAAHELGCVPHTPHVQLASEPEGALRCSLDLGFRQARALLRTLQHGELLPQRLHSLAKRVAGHTERLRQTIQLGKALLQRVEIVRFNVQISP